MDLKTVTKSTSILRNPKHHVYNSKSQATHSKPEISSSLSDCDDIL